MHARKQYLAQIEREDRAKADKRREQEEQFEYTSHLFHPLAFGAEPIDHQIDWLIEGLLPKGYLAIIAAEPKEGKTSFATALALAVATGTEFIDRKTTQAGVLWLSLEEGPTERAQILAHVPEQIKTHQSDFPIADTFDKAIRDQMNPGKSAIRNPRSEIVELPFYTTYNPIHIDTERGLKMLGDWVGWANAGLIVVDPLQAAHSGRSLTDGWGARRTLQLLKQFCTQRNVTALVLHHLGKRGKARRVAESAQLSATASMFMLMERSTGVPPVSVMAVPAMDSDPPSCGRDGDNQASPESRVTNNESRITAHDSRSLKIACRGRGAFANQVLHLKSEHPLHYEPVEQEEQGEEQKPTKPPCPTEQAILQCISTGGLKTTSELVCEIDGPPGTLRNAITRLYNRGDIVSRGTKCGARLYGTTKKDQSHVGKVGKIRLKGT